ncbi:hypothetical protein OROHE_007673 [Orobanche hederae]
MALLNHSNMGPASLFRSEMGYTELEKRQLFLRSYQFSRKQSMAERIKKSFFRVKRVIRIRFRSARNLRKMLWLKLKDGLFFTARRRNRFFLRFRNCNYNYYYRRSTEGSSWESSCFS